ncbi:hypothetical protein [Actinosynnema pretiosum]|uniref:hypothetical protein n=1 Tax=Actinosynnema pretiosum TaxID=42197 RepID=UPI0018DF8E92|nr:hypothetical protein [Actinosynnema pretiosum]
MTRKSLLDGHETYVALRVTGSVPEGLPVTAPASAPGCDRDSWDCESSTPDRPPGNNEQVWFNLMDPAAASELLADDFTA